MNFTDEQLLRIQECLALRVSQLEKKQAAIDAEIADEAHEIRGIMNYVSLELTKRRMKK